MSEMLSNLKEAPLEIWIVFGVLVIAALIALILFRKNKNTSFKKMNTRVLVLGGMCIALSFILSFFKLMRMPQGGSITLASMFPLALYAFVFGPVAGTIAGFAYGILDFIQEAYAAHWISILLDYPLAYACLGIVGFIPMLFKRTTKKNVFFSSISFQFTLGLFIALSCRFFMHLLSGVVFFAEYAPEGMNPWAYSAGYNISFLSIEFIITSIIGIILISTPIYKSLKITASQIN
ncbi:MAG: energy-coupled thiamine transporter ThiT [Cellulosilyticaceae bacterium]